MYCPYCGLDHDDDTVIESVEHVIPISLGGTDDLTILTCKKSNNDLGTAVDAPFMNFFPIQAKRFFLGLESKDGNSPKLDLGGTGWIDGKEVPISYLISEKSKELKIGKPTVVQTPGKSGMDHWHVSGDAGKVMEILRGKVRKQVALGKTVTLDDGTPLTLENLEEVLADRTTTTNPSVLKTLHYDHMISVRFFSKVALAMGHLYLGEEFSRSAHASDLRQNLNAPTMDDVKPIGHLWPEIEHVEQLLRWFQRDAFHTLAIWQGDPPMLLVSLFGEIGGILPLGPIPADGSPRLSDVGRVWQIELPFRKMTTLSIQDFLAERLNAVRMKGEGA